MKKIVILSGSLYLITTVSLYFGYHNHLDRDLMIFYTSVLFLVATICLLAINFLVRSLKSAAKARKHA